MSQGGMEIEFHIIILSGVDSKMNYYTSSWDLITVIPTVVKFKNHH